MFTVVNKSAVVRVRTLTTRAGLMVIPGRREQTCILCQTSDDFGRVCPGFAAHGYPVNFFDTAEVYGDKGGNETMVGRWSAQGGQRREHTVLATEVYGAMDDPRRWPR